MYAAREGQDDFPQAASSGAERQRLPVGEVPYDFDLCGVRDVHQQPHGPAAIQLHLEARARPRGVRAVGSATTLRGAEPYDARPAAPLIQAPRSVATTWTRASAMACQKLAKST